MKKIYFNNKYSQLSAVLKKRKTMFRQVISDQIPVTAIPEILRGNKETIAKYAPYQAGEILAIEQPYGDIFVELLMDSYIKYSEVNRFRLRFSNEPGWFDHTKVSSEFMPHRIRVESISLERLRDISSDDCFKEGIEEDFPFYWAWLDEDLPNYREISFELSQLYPDKIGGPLQSHFWKSPQAAFYHLFLKSTGTIKKYFNPLVWAVSFQLIC